MKCYYRGPCEDSRDNCREASHQVALVEMQDIPVSTMLPKGSGSLPSKCTVPERTTHAERDDSEAVGPPAFGSLGGDDGDVAAVLFESSREVSNKCGNPGDRS